MKEERSKVNGAARHQVVTIQTKIKMRTKALVIIGLCLTLCVGEACAQLAVVDPTNLAQGIVNSTREIVQTSTTAQNMINNCAPVKVIW